MSEQPSTMRTASTEDHSSTSYGLEVLAVLGVSLGMSAIYSVLDYVRAEVTVHGGIANATATVIAGANTQYRWLDLLDDLAGILNGIVPPLLALLLLARDPGGPGFGIGFAWRRTRGAIGSGARRVAGRVRSDWLWGLGFAALIGLPGLGLVYLAHVLGLNASLQVVDFPDVWYRVPYLLLSAFQNGLSEEIIVVGYLLTRLRQLGWSDGPALAGSALLRGTYHLYQGTGAFVGNAVMGLIFGFWFQRTRRVLPLVIAHSVIDAASFIGYVYLHNRIRWI
jgi:membrane protease YdiL (CAAX protease family)